MITENDFIIQKSIIDWGITWHIMEKSGLAFARAYIYHNSLTYIYLDMLYVDECARKDGIGRKLQEIREQIGKELGAEHSMLWVKTDSWMKEWYERRGYTYYCEKNKHHIWMEKSLL
jgi:GNAT superfamily N-acetyltransferase